MLEEQFRKTFCKNLNYYMSKKGIKQSDLVIHFKTAKSTISSWCTGAKLPRMDKIEDLAAFLGIKKSDLLDEKPLDADNTSSIHQIPVLGYISAGLPLYADEQIQGYICTEHNGGAEYFALKVKGDSMSAAHINDGNIIVVRKQAYIENGEIAVVCVNHEDATVKRFNKIGDSIQLIPQSLNPNHQIQTYDLKNTDIQIIGKVVECKIAF